MVDVIKLYNRNLQRIIVMDRDNADYLIDDNGLSWGEIDSTLSTINNLDGYGATLNAVMTSEPRLVTVTGWVIGTEAQMATKKALLNKILAPQNTIWVQVPVSSGSLDSYYLDTKLTKAVNFSQEYISNNEVMCRFTFELSATYPFFLFDKYYSISQSGYEVLNRGSIPAGVELNWIFDSDVSDPEIEATMQDGRHSGFRLLGDYDAGTSVVLNTKYGNKQLTINNRRNFAAMDATNGWFQLPVSYTDSDYITIDISAGTHLSNFSYSESYSALEGL